MTTNPSWTLMNGLVGLHHQPFEENVAVAARRSLFNVLGNAIGAAHADAVTITVNYATATGQSGNRAVLGRSETFNRHAAALINGIAVHYDDFDDTHLETVIHPGAVGLAALIAAPRHTPLDVALRAFGLGIEAQLRIGSAISPSHYHRGWHITGTCGVFGAAVTTGLLYGHDADTLTRALAFAAPRALGVREGFGTMTKPFHPGRAAVNGIRAAHRAIIDTDTETLREPLIGDGLFCDVYADQTDVTRITGDIGTHFELFDNAFKPYPCGIVSHPGIYAATLLHPRITGTIESVKIISHPLVVDLTGNPDPTDGLEARFSTIHGVCAGLIDGEVALAQYTNERVTAADLVALRAKTTLIVDDTIARDQSRIEVTLSGGDTLIEEVQHAPGSITRPLTDDELYTKVDTLITPVL
ncbi:MAG: MmgE/PrpD family protein, partial [Nitriliruptoraceae bacterium]